MLHPTLESVTTRIQARSRATREAYLSRIESAAALASSAPHRCELSCANQAHAFAASPGSDKSVLRGPIGPNVAIISAYNDMLSAHQPLAAFPEWIKQAARTVGATAQFAGGVPAMCDGITQGQPGMELSLFSRDVIAMSTAIALSHNMFDAVLCLGVCDKIVPGMLIGALQFGHLPAVFVPAGPMSSGIPNDEKAKMRQRFAAGEVPREALLDAEAKSYHGAGTCTFYGTANSNQMLMEIMGLHLPGSAFVHPGSPLREALTRAATVRAASIVAGSKEYTPLGRLVDEKTIVNGLVGLLATGGSTNHTMHLVAIARAAGIHIDWEDFDTLSAHVPLLMRVYPNGKGDINHFHAAGGMGFLIQELLGAGLLHQDVATIMGPGLHRYAQEPWLVDENVKWRGAPEKSLDESILRPAGQPFSESGGLRLLTGNLGRAVIKVSAVLPEHRWVLAPAMVFHSQEALLEAYAAGRMNRDLVAIVRFQGPRANGMPELHKLTPALVNLQDKGFNVALLTDGRMSGASGKIPAAIHLSPEAATGGALAKLQDGDLVELDANRGILRVDLDESVLASRIPATLDPLVNSHGMGRELFGLFRRHATSAEEGATSFGIPCSEDRP